MNLGCGMASDPLLLDEAYGCGAVANDATGSRIEAVTFDGHHGALHCPAPERARGVVVVLCPPVGRKLLLMVLNEKLGSSLLVTITVCAGCLVM